jgi:hypothetical protein
MSDPTAVEERCRRCGTVWHYSVRSCCGIDFDVPPDAGPCSICSKPFAECACTAEQKTQAWRDWFTDWCVQRDIERSGDI